MGIIQRRRRRQQSAAFVGNTTSVEGAIHFNQATVPTSTPAISPPAKKLALENGIDWAEITGTSATGMITLGDVKKEIAQRTAAATPAPVIDLTDTVITPENPEAKGVRGNTNVLPQ